MQIDPRAAQMVMETIDGAELALTPGKEVVARVVAAAQDGAAKISLAGQILAVQSNVPLEPGAEIRLSVTQASSSTVQLSILPAVNPSTSPPASNVAPPQPGVVPLPTAATSGANAAVLVPTIPQATSGQGPIGVQLPAALPQPTGAQAVIAELAKLGVPVDATVANAVARVVEHLGGGAEATRAVAQLASRDLALSSAAATRVAAALDVAGKLGPALDRLAAQAPTVAAALPTNAPSATALRNVLAPVLEPAELALARIVQAGEAARTSGSAAPAQVVTAAQQSATAPDARAGQSAAPGSEAANNALRSYASAKLAATVSTAGAPLLDSAVQRASTTAAAAGAAQDAAATRSAASTTATPPLSAPATQAQQAARAAVIGTVATSGTDAESALLAPAAGATSDAARAARAANVVDLGAGRSAANTGTLLPLVAQRSSLSAASAAAATGTATAIATPTAAPVADAVADLATMAARIAPSMGPALGAAGNAAATQSNATNTLQTAQNAGAQGAAGTSQASNAGAGAGGDPRPVITAVSQFLASGGTPADRAQLLHTLQGASTAAIAAAVRQLPEGDALRFAGAMLQSLPGGDASVPHGGADGMRRDIHRALDDLGRGLAHAARHGDDELAALRSALQQVASSDARPAVAHDAARLLGAMDGQQLLSRTQTGADAGFLYFQVPLPDGRGAEVVVRRDPARREVSFDEFNIAFLLDTEQLGTLMIQLDAHPAGIKADVKTDIAALQPFLEAQSAALIEPLTRESRRPVTVSVGAFDADPPTSLLEPQLGLIAPGTTEFYA